MKNFHKTILFTIILTLITVISITLVQLNGQGAIKSACSYLDPPTIDILAFIASLFLVIEGTYRIIEHKKDSLKSQMSRSVRIAAGFTILALHIIQFIHK